jgi:hypothetical protein
MVEKAKAKAKSKAATTRRGLGRDDIKKAVFTTNETTNHNTTQPNSIQPDITHKISAIVPELTSVVAPQVPKYSSEQNQQFSAVAQIRIDAQLFESLNNAVESAIFGGNYAIESASHFIRESLREHIAGKELKVAHQNGIKKPLSLRLDNQLYEFWQTLPKRHRNNILERAIRTKLASYLT